MKPCFDLFTNKPQTQTNTRNISGTGGVRKKRQLGMRKTKPQAKTINKFVVFWQTHILTFAVIDHKTTNIPEISQVFMVLYTLDHI